MFKRLMFLLIGSAIMVNIAISNSATAIKQKNINSVDTKTILKMIKKNPNIRFIDVRTKDEILSQGGYPKVNKYTNIPRGELEFKIADEVNKDELFVVHCYNGNKSLLAAKKLKQIGYKNVVHYKDSYAGWQKAGLKTSSMDRYINSMLYNKIEKVADGIYVSIGQTSPATYENSGHNNNLGFIIGKKYVLVWNASANYLLAKSLHQEIKKITNKKVKYVLLENSQGHAMLGSNYWQEQGAKIVSQKIAKDEIKKLGDSILKRHKRVYKDKSLATKLTTPDIVFDNKMVFDLGGIKVEALYFGYAHEHSDICLWLPKQKIVFAGDLAFNQRLLPIFEITRTDKWLEAWDKFAKLNAKIVVPGHGDVTDMKTVTKYTKDYLVYIRKEVSKILENDGELEDAYNIDQSAYEHLDTFKELAKQNIARLFKQMEFE